MQNIIECTEAVNLGLPHHQHPICLTTKCIVYCKNVNPSKCRKAIFENIVVRNLTLCGVESWALTIRIKDNVTRKRLTEAYPAFTSLCKEYRNMETQTRSITKILEN